MRRRTILKTLKFGTLASALALSAQANADEPARRSDRAVQLASGHYITPTALRGAVQQFLNPGLAAYPKFVAGEAVRSQLSPDGKTLAVQCAGQNSLDKPDGTVDTENSTQYVFLYDVSGANKPSPRLLQVLKPVNAHVGLVFSPDGSALYATGGKDDLVYVYKKVAGAWAASGTIALGHGGQGLGVRVSPNASGLGISADGTTLVVANNYNDSISVIDTATASVRYEHDLRPFFANNEAVQGGAGGTFPFAVVIKGNDTAYVSSDRDREVVAIDIRGKTAGKLIKRIKLPGNALGMTLDKAGARLFVAQDNVDRVAIIDTASQAIVANIDARAPQGFLAGEEHGEERERGRDQSTRHTGAATFSVTLSPDEKTLYAVNAGANSIAVIPLDHAREQGYRVTGLIPTAYEPHDITFSADGKWMYVINGKSVTGPNPGDLASATGSITSTTYPGGNSAAAAAARASNQYQFQLERASLVSAPVPSSAELARLTTAVVQNNFYSRGSEEGRKVMGFLREHIKHVIYVVKENRTFDQVLGDLDNGADGDASITQFGEAITPNQHRFARQFVTLDNFMDPGDGSMDGWSWSLQGRVTNTESLTQQINYAFVNRGLSYESEGTNRNVAVNFATVAERDAASGPAGTAFFSGQTSSLPGGSANSLPGKGNHASSDAPFGIEGGYIFSAVLKAGGSVRNYGFLVNNVGNIGTQEAPISDPHAAGEVQVAPLDPSLAPFTDVYFRGYDQNYPDLWRYDEWRREFDQFAQNGNLPSLSLVRLSHDHMGSFATALGDVNTPESQQADHDLAVGLMAEAVSKSRYASDTLLVYVEDDCQDGPDHVDSHRATAYMVGPYVKRGAVISKRYSQVNALRTIEDILGTQHINLNTAYQEPMTEVFDIRGPGTFQFAAQASTALDGIMLAHAGKGLGAAFAKGEVVKPKHDAKYWARATAGFDFSEADHVPPGKFNRVVWKGMMGEKAYPLLRRGRDQAVRASEMGKRAAR